MSFFYDGVFYDGVFYDDVFYDGVFYDGVFYDGVFWVQLIINDKIDFKVFVQGRLVRMISQMLF